MYHIFFQWKYLTLCLFYEKIELIDFLIEGAEVSDFPIKEQNFQYFILKVLKKKTLKLFILFYFESKVIHWYLYYEIVKV